jgi:hypothetical protein
LTVWQETCNILQSKVQLLPPSTNNF